MNKIETKQFKEGTNEPEEFEIDPEEPKFRPEVEKALRDLGEEWLLLGGNVTELDPTYIEVCDEKGIYIPPSLRPVDKTIEETEDGND